MGCILEMKGISKTFPGVKALQGVDLSLDQGDILALLGENGAGKSTLIKILSGAYTADEGEIWLEGKKVNFNNPKDSIREGISVMYQELNNVDELTIAENIFLGNLPKRKLSKTVDYKTLRVNTEALLRRIGLHHDPFTEESSLSIAEKQMVEIAKALSKDIKILVMDEPTAALNKAEIETLFKIIKMLASEGKSIIYISHRLDEIFEVSNKVQVMRDGKKVALLNTAETDRQQLIAHMVGRTLGEMYPKKTAQKGRTVLEVKGLTTSKVRDISFSVAEGEVVGLFGLMGSGRTNIVETIFGANRMLAGEIWVNGKKTKINSPANAKKHGIAYVPADRKQEGLILSHTVKANISIAIIDRLQKLLALQFKKETQTVRKWVEQFSIRTPGIDVEIDSLSGGNQQKVVLAKWLATEPRVLILNEPTRGVDVGAKAEIYKLIEQLQHSGIATIMISSELPEIIAMSDRIIVIHEGSMAGELTKEDFTQENLLIKAIGGKNNDQ